MKTVRHGLFQFILGVMFLQIGCSGSSDGGVNTQDEGQSGNEPNNPSSQACSWVFPTDETSAINPSFSSSSTLQFVGDLDVQMDASGNSYIVYTREGAQPDAQIYLSEYHGSWEHPQNETDTFVHEVGHDVKNTSLSVAENGSVLLAYSGEDKFMIDTYNNGNWSRYERPGQSYLWGNVGSLNGNGEGLVISSFFTGVSNNYRDVGRFNGVSWSNFDERFTLPVYDLNTTINSSVVNNKNHDAFFVVNSSSKLFRANYTTAGGWQHTNSLNGYFFDAGISSIQNLASEMDESGNIVVVWSALDGIYVSDYRNQTWRDPTDSADRFDFSGSLSSKPSLSINTSGQAVISFISNGKVYVREYVDGSWTNLDIDDPAAQGPAGQVYQAVSKVTEDGRILLAFTDLNQFPNSDVYLRERSSSGTWEDLNGGLPISVTQDYVWDMSLATSANGEAIVTWHQGVDSGINSHVYMAECRN